MVKAKAVLVCALVCGLWLTAQAPADTVTNLAPGQSINLAQLIDPNGVDVQIGDKLFDDFFFGYTDNDGPSSNDLIASNVLVTALTNQIGFGLSFQQPLIAVGSAFKDMVLKYSVQVLDSNMLISDAHLSITGSTLGQGTADVGEDIFVGGFGATNIGHMEAHLPPPGSTSTNIFFAQPQVKIFVQKDIVVSGNGSGTGDRASLTIIDQTFSQVPEPSSVMLVTTGLLGFICLGRRRQ